MFAPFNTKDVQDRINCIMHLSNDLYTLIQPHCPGYPNGCIGCICVSRPSGECIFGRVMGALSELSERIDEVYGPQENTKRCN